MKYTENKIAKILAIMFKAKSFLNKKCSLSLYYSYIYNFIDYKNILDLVLSFLM